MHPALAVLTWDPQIRGALIVLVAVLILPGSVYLLLATNMGAKVGLLLAIAGLSGWLLLLNIVWLGYGIGYKGSIGTWTPREIVVGNLVEHSGIKAVSGTPGRPSTQFPNGWTALSTTNSLRASAAPAADTALIPPAAGAKATSGFAPPFTTTQDYIDVAAYGKGGHNYVVDLFGYKVYWRIRHHFVYFKHQPDYVIIRVSPSLPSVTLAGAAATLPAADVSQPMTSVVLERNVGSLRLPPILIGTAALIVFGITTEKLHSRDKQIARRKAEEKAGGGTPPRAETQPAGELPAGLGGTTMAGYLPLLTLVVLATGFVAISFLGSGMLGPKRPTAAKAAPYESGIVPARGPAQRFPVRFYLVAMIFIIFDIEIIFTYPWAVIYTHDLGKFGLVEMVVFAVAVFVSFLYLISNGALDWGPVKRAVRPLSPAEEPRTSSSTVRRVTKEAVPPGSEEVA